MLLHEVIKKIRDYLKSQKISSPLLEADLLAGYFFNLKRSDLYTQAYKVINEKHISLLYQLAQKRVQGFPMAYILGYKYFYKSQFFITPQVFIPRPETEILVERTVSILNKPERKKNVCRIIDLGTGSGCIGLSILMENPKAKLLALDISEPAINIAQKNAQKMNLTSRVQFLKINAHKLTSKHFPSSWQNSCDLITANPPYISSGSFHVDKSVIENEPHEALFSHSTGLEHFKIWTQKASQMLTPGGFFICEIGHSQGELAKAFIQNLKNMNLIEIQKDLSQKDRVIIVQKR